MEIEPKDERLLGSKELAHRLGISTTTLKRWRAGADCDLPKPVRIRSRLLWRLSSVVAYIDAIQS